MKLFVSIRPDQRGGGSNSFAYHFVDWAKRNGFTLCGSIEQADTALVIAHCGVTLDQLQTAKDNGCWIVHRIDEHLGGIQDERYQEKHRQIAEINRFADVTVFQSLFVEETAGPVLQPAHYEVILNGGTPRWFYPPKVQGDEIGHVTWSLISKKRLDLVAEAVSSYPDETFRLVGNQKDGTGDYPSLRAKNVKLRGTVRRKKLRKEYAKMKVLYFPSMNDPCPNTVIESILCGVPVCYHPSGGTPELVRDCGEPLERFDHLLDNIHTYRERCLKRKDLDFDLTAEKYAALLRKGSPSG